MADAAPYLRGPNLKLLIASAVIAGGTLIVSLGPCAHQRTSLREDLAQRQGQFDRLQKNLRGFRPIEPRERERWQEIFEGAERWIPTAEDEPGIVAEVARIFVGGSVRSLEVQRAEAAPSKRAVAWETVELRSAAQERRFTMRAIPLHVRFTADYGDTARILAKLETAVAPLLLERLEIQRQLEELRTEADVIFIVRGASHEG